MTKIAVLTSGGDAPGMNAAIRAVVRTSLYHGLEVFGVARGYNGMIDDDIFPMDSRSVANIIQRGGTILKTSRCMEFMQYEGRKKAFENLDREQIKQVSHRLKSTSSMLGIKILSDNLNKMEIACSELNSEKVHKLMEQLSKDQVVVISELKEKMNLLLAFPKVK